MHPSVFLLHVLEAVAGIVSDGLRRMPRETQVEKDGAEEFDLRVHCFNRGSISPY